MSLDQNALAESLSADTENDIDNGGVGPGDAEEQGESMDSQGYSENDPLSIKKRLGMQAKKHQREIRALHERMSEMQSRMSDNANPQQYHQDSYNSPGQPNPPSMNEQERIQEAVKMAFGMQEEQQRQQKQAQSMAHIQKEYQRLNGEFDRASEKFEDFDDVVRGDDTPFTESVRDALLLIDNPADVAYKLAKNRPELERISKLHPLQQAKEVNKLSFSLMNDGLGRSGAARSTPLGNVRANPAGASQAITDKTPSSVIRARMKAGTWK